MRALCAMARTLTDNARGGRPVRATTRPPSGRPPSGCSEGWPRPAPPAPSGPAPQPRMRPTHPLKVLYLFAGIQRQADVGCHLRRLEHEFNDACNGYSIKLELREVDILRYVEDDLSDKNFQAEIKGQIAARIWDVVIAAPPCNTFSRATFSGHPGPRPIRDITWPRGFPVVGGR